MQQFQIYEGVLERRRRGGWKWCVCSAEGEVMVRGFEVSRPAARYNIRSEEQPTADANIAIEIAFAIGWDGNRRESESIGGAKHFRHPRICKGAHLRQGYPGYTSNPDEVCAVAIRRSWRADQGPRGGIYQSGVRSKDAATRVIHDPLLSARSWERAR